MKKRVLSLFMALALCLTMLPTAVLAEETGAASDAGNVESVYTIGDDTVVQIGEESDPVQVAQALIDALPEDVTAENAEEIEQQLMALDAALEALTDEQLAQLDMTRYKALCAAMTALVAVQDGEHSHPICGDADCTEIGHQLSNGANWQPINTAAELTDISAAGYYYLTASVELTTQWEPVSGVVLCLNGNSITEADNFDVISVATSSHTFTLCDCKNTGSITHATNNTGRGVLVGGTFNMYGGSITGNSASGSGYGGGVSVSSGTFYMYGGSITGNKASGSSYGGGVYVANGGSKFTMSGGEITTNTAGSIGGGVYVDSHGSFTMSGDAKITTNTADSIGGGVYVDGTFDMSGGSITGNRATSGYGGGVYVGGYGNGTFNMSGGSIGGSGADANTAKNGGGVYVDKGEFTMSGGSVTGNTASSNGGGVYVDKGTFTMKGGSIGGEAGDANTAENGGGVYVSGGTFTMNSGKIAGNSASSFGGGVFVYDTFTMSGGSITGNTATGGNGGGVGISGGTFNMSGGSITKNTATSGNRATSGNGGGVYVYGTFNISGAPSITGNTGADNAANNLYLGSSSNNTITVTGELTGGDGSIGVTTGANFVSGAANVAVGGGTYSLTEDDAKKFRADSSIYETVYDASKKTVVLREKPHNHRVCGETDCTDTNHTDVSFRPLTKSSLGTKQSSGAGLTTVTSYYDLSAGSYYLTEDLKTDATIRIADDVKLCLNGHSIIAESDTTCAILIDGDNASLTLCDCRGGSTNAEYGKITTNFKGRGVSLWKGSFTMYGGSIAKNGAAEGSNSGYGGAGVCVESGKTFTMYGGEITGNNSNIDNGGGVLVGGTFNLYGGSISGNTAKYGGGVYVKNGTFNVSGGKVTGNTASEDGGGVRLDKGTFNMSGSAVISRNTASGDGGGVRLDNGTFNMSGSAVVSRNAADGFGGGVDANNGTFTMSGGSITGNTTTGKSPDWSGGGGVFVYNGGSFTMTGGSITGNNAIMGGGVELSGDGTMTVSGSVQITDNWQNGTLDSTNGSYVQGSRGKANNLYLFTDKTVAIGTDGLNADARIGVTTEDWPDSGRPVKIATNAKNEESHYTAIFTPDAEEADYKITKKNDNALYLSAHEHTWTYTADDTTDTITARCSECDWNGGSTTMTKPEHEKYGDGKGIYALLTPNDWQPALPSNPLTYTKNGKPTSDLSGAGKYTVTLTIGSASVSVDYTVAKAELTIKANDNTIVYGDTASDKGVTYKGFVEDEDESVLGGDLTYTFSYIPGCDTGLYIITPAGKTSDNYDITFIPGTLTVMRREVTLTWHDYENRTYGDGKSVYATAGNLVNNDEIKVTVSGGGEQTSGTHTATATGLTGAKADNYKLPTTGLTKEYTIGLAAQTLTFKSGTAPTLLVTYGGTLDNPATNDRTDGGNVTYTSSNEQIATVDENGTVTAKKVGTATITATAAAVDGKYAEATASYELKVIERNVTVTVDAVSRVYGDANPDFTAELTSGTYAPGDDFQSLDLTLSTTADKTTGVGSYNVTGTASNTNYNVTVLGKEKLTITQRPITFKVDPVRRAYGDANPAFTANTVTAGSRVNQDMIVMTLTTTATRTSPVGSYDVTLLSSDSPNYNITVEGTDALTIDPKPITVTVDAASRVYGSENPAFTATAPSGALVGEDTVASLNLTLTTDATATSPVGTYDVTGTANNGNYDVTVDGMNKLTVTKKELTVNDLVFADTPITKVYDGSIDAAITVQIKDSAKVNADDELPTVTGTCTYNSKDVKTANKVTFVSAKTESANYIFPANLTMDHEATITKRVITIASVQATSKQYDRDTNAWSCITGVTFNNLVAGETLTKGTDYGIPVANFDNANVGEAKTITGKVGIMKNDLNYTFGSEDERAAFTTTGSITPANSWAQDNVNLTIRYNNRAEQRYQAAWSSLPTGQKWTYNLDDTKCTGNAKLASHSIGADTGVLSYQLSAGDANDTVTWTITASCANYQSFTLNVTLTLIARNQQTGFQFENNNADVTKTYGDEDFTISASGEVTGSSVTYTSSDETVAKVDEDGKVTIVGAGTTTIKAKASETADFEEKEISYTLTVKPKTLTKDDLTHSGSITKVYDGSTNAPSGLTVSVDPSSLVNGDTLTVNGTLKFNSANVGEASEITFTPTAITTGNYTLAATEVLTIRNASITAKEVTITDGINATDRSYEKNNKTVALTKGALALTGLVIGETLDVNVPATGTISDATVGTYNVTYSGVTLKDGTTGKARNYKLVDSLPTVTVTISKAAAPVLADIPVSFKYTVTTGEKTIGSVMPDDADTLTYSKGTESKTGSVTVTSWAVDPTTGKVTYTLSNGATNDAVTLPVTIVSTNYEDATVNVVITLTARDNQVELRITGGTTVVYGQTLALNTSGGSGSGAVTYTVVNGTGEATIDPNTGVLTPVKVGSVSVIATKAGDNDYNAVTSAPVEITITKATPTGEPKYTEIKTGGKTLADAALTIEGSTLKPNAGTLEWVDDKGNVLSNDTKVEANTTYKWRFTPTDGNYTVLTGSIELYHKSSSGGSGWYYTYYTIKATAGTNGSISPSGWTSVRDGRDQTFTITPDKGYAVAKVLVDGKSVGAVKSYTFKNVTKDHTIEAIFMKSNGNPQTGVFVDVAEGSYYEEAIDWAVEKGITNGVSSNMFAPNDPCTRAQIVTFLWRAAGSPAPKSMSSFTDVPADAFYAKAVAWAVENGITSGTGESKFSPNSTCTRAQAVTFLYRASGSPAVSGKAEFSDVSTTAFYADAVAWAAKKGITTGIGGGLFGSDNDCTRGQIVTFLWRAMAE